MVKKTKESIGSKAAKLAQDTAASLNKGAETIAQVRSNVGAVAGAITTGRAQTVGAAVDVKQMVGTDRGASQHRTEIVKDTDCFGGLSVPVTDFGGIVPSDLLKPAIGVTATAEELTEGLENYAAGTRAQKLYQAGYKFIEEVGKTKQARHRAQSSIIKGATEGVKVQQEMVRFDRQNIELETDMVKREQSAEKLNQEDVKLLGMQKETTQITRKIEAIEAKRDAEINVIDTQTRDILQKFMIESINS